MTELKLQDVNYFKKALSRGMVKFEYYNYNNDGTLRTGIGTCCPDLLKKMNVIPPIHPFNDDEYTIAYYDLSKGGWRRFNKDKFNIMLDCDLTIVKASCIAFSMALKDAVWMDSCIIALTNLLGEYRVNNMISFAKSIYTSGMDINIFEKNMFSNVFPFSKENVETDGINNDTTQMSITKDDLIKRLIELRNEESKILEKILLI